MKTNVQERDEEPQPEPQERQPGEPPAPERLTIPIGEDAEDDDDGAPQPGDKKSKRSHFRELRESNKRLEKELNELRGRVSAPQPIVLPAPAPQQQGEDPIEGALRNVRAQKQTILRALATPNLPEAEQSRLTDQFHALEDQQAEIQYARVNRRQQAQQPSNEGETENKMLRAQFPKIFASKSLTQYAVAKTYELAEQRRVPVSFELAMEAAGLVYTERGLGGKPPAPTETERARHAGTSSRPAPANSGGQSWQPTKQQLVVARAYTEHRKGLNDAQRAKIWYDEVGKPAGLV